MVSPEDLLGSLFIWLYLVFISGIEQFKEASLGQSLETTAATGQVSEPTVAEEITDMALAVIKNDAMTGEIVVVYGGLSLKTV